MVIVIYNRAFSALGTLCLCSDVWDFVQVKSGIQNAPHAKPLDFQGGAISFENVCFGSVISILLVNVALLSFRGYSFRESCLPLSRG